MKCLRLLNRRRVLREKSASMGKARKQCLEGSHNLNRVYGIVVKTVLHSRLKRTLWRVLNTVL
jgi:hypothetical protein